MARKELARIAGGWHSLPHNVYQQKLATVELTWELTVTSPPSLMTSTPAAK
jgi:hypothetical protein